MDTPTPYLSLAKEAMAEYTEKKSRFLGYAAPIETPQDALAFLARIKSEHPTARHHVYAYRVMQDNATRYSDDGEPQGTAGMPVLDCLRKKDIQNAVVVVVRYFGGTLLGANGLVRAYTRAAADAIAQSGILRYAPTAQFTIVCQYPLYQKLMHILPQFEGQIASSDFAQDVTLHLVLPQARFSPFCEQLSQLSAGTVLPQDVCTKLQPTQQKETNETNI